MDETSWNYHLSEVSEKVKGADWRRIAMFGCFGAAVYFMVSGRKAAGMAAAGIGLATLASEHPEKFEQVWNNMPDYLDRGHRIVNGVQTLIERITESANNVRAMRNNAPQRTGTDQYARPSY
jgi:hypothetical protein